MVDAKNVQKLDKQVLFELNHTVFVALVIDLICYLLSFGDVCKKCNTYTMTNNNKLMCI